MHHWIGGFICHVGTPLSAKTMVRYVWCVGNPLPTGKKLRTWTGERSVESGMHQVDNLSSVVLNYLFQFWNDSKVHELLDGATMTCSWHALARATLKCEVRYSRIRAKGDNNGDDDFAAATLSDGTRTWVSWRQVGDDICSPQFNILDCFIHLLPRLKQSVSLTWRVIKSLSPYA